MLETRYAFYKKKIILMEHECVEWCVAKMYYGLEVERRRIGVEEANEMWNFRRWWEG